MPPAKKKKGKGAAPELLKVKLHLHHIGPNAAEPIDVDIPPSSSLFAAKHLIDKAASAHFKTSPGSLIFGDWDIRECVPSFMSPTRRVCRIDPKLAFDAAWISTLGVQPESCISIHNNSPNNNDNNSNNSNNITDNNNNSTGSRRKVTVEWYTNVPEMSAFKEPPSPKEIAKIEYEKSKIVREEANKKKKKKK